MPDKLGRTALQLTMISTDSLNSDVNLTETLTIDVSVIKTKRMIDKIFNITLFLLVSLLPTRPEQKVGFDISISKCQWSQRINHF